MKTLPILMIAVSALNLGLALYAQELLLAAWSFNTMGWAYLYLTK